MFYIIGIGWVVGMTTYSILNVFNKHNNKKFYDLTNRVIKNKKYQDRVNRNSKSTFNK